MRVIGWGKNSETTHYNNKNGDIKGNFISLKINGRKYPIQNGFIKFPGKNNFANITHTANSHTSCKSTFASTLFGVVICFTIGKYMK